MLDRIILHTLVCTFLLFIIKESNFDVSNSLRIKFREFRAKLVVSGGRKRNVGVWLTKLWSCNFCISFWVSLMYLLCIDENLIFCLTNPVISPIVFTCLKKSLITTG